ncbi:MAG: endonuclease V [Deltaproteobacteria bacterium]|nr:endonuclease V [Deltaproteobacteria bacterium]MBW2077404.1 endonuclease V [Deltaproteobacteria bacterium]MBW2311362.1 endonuclease V [Deltaproteobacteria bacterium]RLB31471.1 MAG: endonuclease V [Deltaproteobacteria bacterium]
MDIPNLHPWNVTYEEAVRIQERLKDKVFLRKINKEIKYIVGLDASYAKGSRTVWAGAVLLDFPSLEKREEQWSHREVSFPYIPGLLSFREIPALLEVLRRMSFEPGLIFCDGQGIAHPRGMGLAAHLGVLVGKPTIGCAKSKLVGEFDPVDEVKGAYTYLRYRDRVVGAVVRTRSKVRPVFVSPGYHVSIDDCVRLVLETCTKYRIPEPTRQANILVNSVRRRYS